jgi:hypothetical protein
MQFAFDLISDLHVETWTDPFDWTAQATSPYCVVAGDVCRDRSLLIKTLTHLGQCYPGGVFYIDGNDEHRDYLEDLGDSYQDLAHRISLIPNVVYLQDHVVIINGVAILGTNGWWSYDLDPDMEPAQSMDWHMARTECSTSVVGAILAMAHTDANYLASSVDKLQTHKEVSAIVVVTHTVPAAWLIQHDLQLSHTHRFNCTGNPRLQQALDMDTESKIRAWTFGHYHGQIDQQDLGIRWINNYRGRGNTEWHQHAYYPQRIEINY